ncbi:MAG TPA: alanine racemase [Actinomycetota bacterium]
MSEGRVSFRSTHVEVDLDAIAHNVRALACEGVGFMAVVKADAYGHGAPEVARACVGAGAAWLGVALVEEGLLLRAEGIDSPIMVLSEFPPGAEAEALAAGLTPVLASAPGLHRLAAVTGATASGIAVHVKVDTGMHRLGVWPPREAPAFVTQVVSAGFGLGGLWTHFARSEEDASTTKDQLDRFLDVVDAVRDAGHEPTMLHTANTAATILHPEARLDLVRVGIGIYGIEPAPGVGTSLGLRPALSWRSSVTMVKRLAAGERISYGHRYELDRDAWIAVVPVGYADGYPRSLSSNADVLIAGRRCRVAGNVTMDQLMVDCGELQPSLGEEVVLLGQQGDDMITAHELGDRAGTIAYEILARIGARVPRRYRP